MVIFSNGNVISIFLSLPLLRGVLLLFHNRLNLSFPAHIVNSGQA
jgi:hypothetical protein